jgi:hypothetical protein
VKRNSAKINGKGIIISIILVLVFWTPVSERIKTSKEVLSSNSAAIYSNAQEFISKIQEDTSGKFAIQARIHDEIIFENAAKEQGMPVMSGLASENAHIFNIWSHENFAVNKKSLELVGANYLMTNKDLNVTILNTSPIKENTQYKLYKVHNPNLYFEELKWKPIWVVYEKYRDMVEINQAWFESFKQSEIPYIIFSKHLPTTELEMLGGLLYFKANPPPETQEALKQLSSTLRVTTVDKVPGALYFNPSLGNESILLPKHAINSKCIKSNESHPSLNSFHLSITCSNKALITFKQGFHYNWNIQSQQQQLQPLKITPFMNAFILPPGNQQINVSYVKSPLESGTILISTISILLGLVVIFFYKKTVED